MLRQAKEIIRAPIHPFASIDPDARPFNGFKRHDLPQEPLLIKRAKLLGEICE